MQKYHLCLREKIRTQLNHKLLEATRVFQLNYMVCVVYPLALEAEQCVPLPFICCCVIFLFHGSQVPFVLCYPRFLSVTPILKYIPCFTVPSSFLSQLCTIKPISPRFFLCLCKAHTLEHSSS